MTPLDFFVIAAVAFAVVAMTAAWLMTLRVPYPKRMANPRGSIRAGIARTFKLALAPWGRWESRAHLPPEIADRFYKRSFLALHYHLAVFTALAMLVGSPFYRGIPQYLAPIPGALLVFGLICGLILFCLRVFKRNLRFISIPDDYIANMLVNSLIASAIAFAFEPKALPVFQAIGGALLIYAPFGKIRHMFFSPVSLLFLGSHLGRLGIRPNFNASRAVDQ